LLAAAGLGSVGTTTVLALLLTAPAQAQAPDVAAWWNSANVGNGAPPPPVPPDVAAGDLLVQGSNAAPASPVSAAPSSSQAVAGLTFALPAGAILGPLTLHVDGTAPPQVTVIACKATRSFFAEENGVWTDVPPSDCTNTVTAAVKGSDIVFADVSKLASADSLSIVLLPGSVDRVVFKKPDASALSVTTSGGVGVAAPPFGSGSNAGPGSFGASGSQPVAPVGGGIVLPPAGTGTGAGTAVAPPVIAPSAPAASNGRPVAATTAAAGGDGLSTSQRRALAAVVIALELVGLLLLLGDRGAERLALGATSALAGGRLRPPDRGRHALRETSMGGIGRFTAPRDGSAPRL
jgi:hypothetical protein